MRCPHVHDQPDHTYPVIYLLDADWYFGLVTELVRMMNTRVPFCDELPDALIVGIGYPVRGSVRDINNQVIRLRTRDLLPIQDPSSEQAIQEFFPGLDRVESGGGAGFMRFIEDELIPTIDEMYRTDQRDRTLMGHSWGGTFALYALFMGGELFRRFVVVSPDLPMGDGYIERCERDYAARHTRLPANLYIAYAEYELNEWHLPHIRPFMDALQSRRYSGLRFFYQTFSGCRHCGVVAPAFQSGLWNVFELPVLI
ncbi:MAG: alpha/beta hydrolase [Chloroflexi bacterium]|nr:alpha/beta hydrolase [Chloroflexota bacterium]